MAPDAPARPLLAADAARPGRPGGPGGRLVAAAGPGRRCWRLILAAGDRRQPRPTPRPPLTGLNEWTGDLTASAAASPRCSTPPLARLDAELPPDARLLLVGQAAVFHVRHPVVYNTVFDDETFETLARGRSPAEVRAALASPGRDPHLCRLVRDRPLPLARQLRLHRLRHARPSSPAWSAPACSDPPKPWGRGRTCTGSAGSARRLTPSSRVGDHRRDGSMADRTESPSTARVHLTADEFMTMDLGDGSPDLVRRADRRDAAAKMSRMHHGRRTVGILHGSSTARARQLAIGCRVTSDAAVWPTSDRSTDPEASRSSRQLDQSGVVRRRIGPPPAACPPSVDSRRVDHAGTHRRRVADGL